MYVNVSFNAIRRTVHKTCVGVKSDYRGGGEAETISFYKTIQ